MPRFKYIDSFTENEDHLYDDYKNLGYNYEHHILKNVLSPELFGNPINDINYRQIEKIFEHLINAVKQIKLAYAFTYPKNAKNLN
jgi:hypothetical protein